MGERADIIMLANRINIEPNKCGDVRACVCLAQPCRGRDSPCRPNGSHIDEVRMLQSVCRADPLCEIHVQQLHQQASHLLPISVG
jgi:hypothetical protein